MSNQPNVIIIMSDQHHAGAMGCMGDSAVQTPVLDGLAARGTRFTNAYCAFPLCGPSRMSFMTCREPSDIGIWTNEQQLNSDVPTFAHAFLAHGYETVLSGRMHFVGGDQRHGYAKRLIGDCPESAYIAAGWKLKRVLGELSDTAGMSLAGIMKSGPGRSGYHAYDEAVTHETVAWLRTRGHQNDAPPFMLTVGYAAPHCPFVAPPDDFAKAAQRITPADLPDPGPDPHPAIAAQRRQFGVDPLPPVDAQWRARVAYYGLCAFLDRQIGQVLAALEDSGLADNTIIVYTSDHGEMLGEHGVWWKRCFYEGSARVPMLVAWPGHIPAQTVSTLASLNDIGATLLDLIGANPLPSATGRSLMPIIDGKAENWDDTVVSENVLDFEGRIVPCRMVRRGPWKFNYYHGMRPELFNVADDPGELHDLWDDPACAAVVEELNARALRDWNPEYGRARVEDWHAEQPLLAAFLRAAQPVEPDPLWFTNDPENWHTEVPLPIDKEST